MSEPMMTFSVAYPVKIMVLERAIYKLLILV